MRKVCGMMWLTRRGPRLSPRLFVAAVLCFGVGITFLLLSAVSGRVVNVISLYPSPNHVAEQVPFQVNLPNPSRPVQVPHSNNSKVPDKEELTPPKAPVSKKLNETKLPHAVVVGKSPVSKKINERKLPHAIVVGVQKSGTSALNAFLKSHPNVCTSKIDRETHFFTFNHINGRWLPKKNLTGLEGFRKEMPWCTRTQITVDVESLSFATPLAPSLVHEMNASVKLMVIVRDPIARLLSSYRHDLWISKMKWSIPFLFGASKYFTKLNSTFQEMVFDNKSGEVDVEKYFQVNQSAYDLSMPRWYHYFPHSQIHVVDGEGLLRKPWLEMIKIERFLGLPPHFSKDSFRMQGKNETGFYCLKSVPVERGCLTANDKKYNKGHTYNRLSQDQYERLKTHYRPHTQNFFRMSHLNFDWPSLH